MKDEKIKDENPNYKMKNEEIKHINKINKISNIVIDKKIELTESEKDKKEQELNEEKAEKN